MDKLLCILSKTIVCTNRKCTPMPKIYWYCRFKFKELLSDKVSYLKIKACLFRISHHFENWRYSLIGTISNWRSKNIYVTTVFTSLKQLISTESNIANIWTLIELMSIHLAFQKNWYFMQWWPNYNFWSMLYISNKT